MRNNRRPRVSLKNITCSITDSASATNTKPMNSNSSTWPSIIATMASVAPSASDPESPMKTSAGWALNHKNASRAPATVKQNVTR